MTTQFAVTEEFGRNSLKKLTVHDTELLNMEARLACDMIIRWGLVTGKLAGEDTVGRAVIKECTPQEVVERACDTAELSVKMFRERGWIVAGPDVSELMRKTDD